MPDTSPHFMPVWIATTQLAFIHHIMIKKIRTVDGPSIVRICFMIVLVLSE